MFYDNFYLLCKKAGVTPTQVARDLGIRQSTVSMWKKQASTPRYETLQKLADYFSVPISRLTESQSSSQSMCNAIHKILEDSIVKSEPETQKATLQPTRNTNDKEFNYNFSVSIDAMKVALDYEQLDEAGKVAIKKAIAAELTRYINK